MGALLFLSLFVALGLGVVLVAMRGGPRGLRDTLEAERRKPLHAAEFAITGAIVLFGLVVPAIVLLGDQASAGPGGSKLNAAATEGREVFALRCSQCHALEDAGAFGRVGPDLDNLRPKSSITLDAIEKGRARGQGQMPAELLEDEEAHAVASYIERVAGR
ncbi:MAG: cytochrome c [Actinomycetota bacterium]|nr:cytochrome c [Actinomycetota bacterium]